MIELNIGKRKIKTDKNAFVMGILNVTPDSFFSESRGGFEKALEIIEQGADIIDIGGESTRPGFSEVNAEDEIKRIIPVIKAIRKESDIPISVDTRKAKVLKAALENGADILNDVSALEDDSEIAEVAASYNCGVILMHRPLISEENREDDNQIEKSVLTYLLKRADYACKIGIKKENIIFDPGIGFGKTMNENIQLIKNCDYLCKSEFPVLMALSRKRCIGFMTSQTVENRLAGTLSADLISVTKGCKLIRVHDVKEAVDSLNIMKYIY